jgi:hypothetical protein
VGVDKKKEMLRPLRSSDFWVVFAGFFNNITQAVEVFSEELLELAIYNANRRSKVDSIWEQFSQDLETIQEDKDGA